MGRASVKKKNESTTSKNDSGFDFADSSRADLHPDLKGEFVPVTSEQAELKRAAA
jgi:hypothetical protein